MSILDMGFDTREEFIVGLELAAPAIDGLFEEFGWADENFTKLLKAGYSPYEILAMDKEHLNAMFLSGFQYLSAGNLQRAKDTFQLLTQLDPMDERFIFALASAYQLENDYSAAGKLYVFFIALNATDVDGYLRLGECLMGAHEYEEADDVFKTAVALCEKGHGNDEARQYSEIMIANIIALKEEKDG